MSDPRLLGDYLRARRAQVRPEDAGVVVTGVRRTPGLRREEVATLAGISADYYLRLEQGRDRNPSAQVLDALARVLRLDATARAHLHELAAGPAPARARLRRETVPTGVAMLLTSIGLPAFVENRRFDVLVANPLAEALSTGMRPGANRLRSFVLDEREHALWTDWEAALEGLVAGFRTSIGAGEGDPAVARLVGELSLASEPFRRAWARHDVRPLAGAASRLRHPQVGDLELRREKLPLADTDGQILVVYHAEPGSTSAERLGLLGSLVAADQIPEALNRSPRR
ncbi:helix-turn-helix domain-containing protein [Amnibacterium kyonggiense]|nr:helix-turn-helix transcriptional regulator [Amnibacterium kyonggiense]